MAISANMEWEIRSLGATDNGGGFVNGATGTDYSQQNAAQETYTDLVIDAATDTNVTSVLNPFTSLHVGNVVNITGGTGFTTGRYEVKSVTTGVATLDRAVGTLSSTGGTGKLGGAAIFEDAIAKATVAGNKVWIKKDGTHTVVAAIAGTSSAFSSTSKIIYEGYNITKGDGIVVANRPFISSGVNDINIGTYNIVKCIDVLSSSFSSLVGNAGFAFFCKVNNATATANRSAFKSFQKIESCEASCVNGFGLDSISHVLYCYIHDCVFGTNNTDSLTNSTIANCTSDGVVPKITSQGHFAHVTIDNCGNGIRATSIFYQLSLKNCIISNCATGLNLVNLNNIVAENINFFNNTTDNLNNNPIINETNLDPQFVNAAGGDFETGANMNITQTFPAGLTSTTIKNGAVQSNTTTGGGGSDKIGKLIGYGGGLVG